MPAFQRKGEVPAEKKVREARLWVKKVRSPGAPLHPARALAPFGVSARSGLATLPSGRLAR